MSGSGGSRRRAVVLVPNAFAPYSRALRIGRSLESLGYDVEIAAMRQEGLPDVDSDGDIVVRRYGSPGPRDPGSASAPVARVEDGAAGGRDTAGGGTLPGGPGTAGGGGTPAGGPGAAGGGDTPAGGPGTAGGGTLPGGPGTAGGGDTLPGGGGTGRRDTGQRRGGGRRRERGSWRRTRERWEEGLAWPPVAFRAWWEALDRDCAPADLYHGFGVYSLPPALRARDRASGHPVVVYDVVDDWFRSQTAMAMPAAIRLPRMLAEAVRARRADAILTVDRPQAVQLERRWRPRRPIVSIPNYPQIPRDVDVLHQDRIRAELGLPATTRIVLYQGNIGSAGPLRIAEKACLAIADACFVVIGFGAELERVRERDSDAQYRGRHFTLAARHPDELIAWTASADVVLMRFRASSPNDRLTVPNKLWEALAGGTPVVVGRGQGPMARFVERHDLGAVAEAMTPDAVAAAIRRVIDRGPEERAAWRARIAAEARERWDWRASDARYRALISQVVAEAGP